ncbi:hypothetical protein HDU96_004540 [Phlyctochytrium bullatum]|nr:hypothetical protein HDU96_004540 [Phlyctochytrium bullatum]
MRLTGLVLPGLAAPARRFRACAVLPPALPDVPWLGLAPRQQDRSGRRLSLFERASPLQTPEQFDPERFDEVVKQILSEPINWNGSELTVKNAAPLPVVEDENESAPQAELVRKFIVARMVSQFLGCAVVSTMLSASVVELFAKAFGKPIKWMAKSVKGDDEISTSSALVKCKPFPEPEKLLNIVEASGTSEYFAPVIYAVPRLFSDTLAIRSVMDEPASHVAVVDKSIVARCVQDIFDRVTGASESADIQVIKRISPIQDTAAEFVFSVESDVKLKMATLRCRTNTHSFLISAKIISADDHSITFRININAACERYEYVWEEKVTFPIEVLRVLSPLFQFFGFPEFFECGAASSSPVAGALEHSKFCPSTITRNDQIPEIGDIINTYQGDLKNVLTGDLATFEAACGIPLNCGMLGKEFVTFKEIRIQRRTMPKPKLFCLRQIGTASEPIRNLGKLRRKELYLDHFRSVQAVNLGLYHADKSGICPLPWTIGTNFMHAAPSAEPVSGTLPPRAKEPGFITPPITHYRHVLKDFTLDAGSITTLVRETFASLSQTSIKISASLRSCLDSEKVHLAAGVGLASAHLLSGCIGWLRDVIRDQEPIDTQGEVGAARSVAHPMMLLDAHDWDKAVVLVDRGLCSVWGKGISEVVDEPAPIPYQAYFDLQGAGSSTDTVKFLELFFREFAVAGNIVAGALATMQDGADQVGLAVAAEVCRRCAGNAVDTVLNQVRGRACFTEGKAQEVMDAVELVYYPLSLVDYIPALAPSPNMLGGGVAGVAIRLSVVPMVAKERSKREGFMKDYTRLSDSVEVPFKLAST